MLGLKPTLISQPQNHLQRLLATKRNGFGEAEEQAMPMDDDERPRKKVSHEIGQDLSLLSVEELTERIALLTGEIERLKEAAGKKRASKDAADSFFKR